MNNEYNIESSSFRDNLGNVYNYKDRILRSIKKSGKQNYDFIKDSGLIEASVKEKYLVNTYEIEKKSLPEFFNEFEFVLESQVVPCISYPYEWTFEQLKIAALHHLDFQIFLFGRGAILRDASAYNIQFIGSNPIFIDVLSIQKYEDGEYWSAYKQFCENFLNPLILGSSKGISHNDCFRGALEGIESKEINKLLNFRDKLSYKIFIHVVLQTKFIEKSLNNPKITGTKLKTLKKYPKNSYLGLLHQLRNWISKMQFKKDKSIWENYTKEHTYQNLEYQNKKKFVTEFVKRIKPDRIIDLGCNTGEFSKISLDAGAKYAVGFDFDSNAITEAYKKAYREKINFLPLMFNAANPSPNQGWLQQERKGFIERFKSDALIALAFEHHLIIGKNIPIDQFFFWLSKISKYGLIEFVPKSDSTVQKMLEYREDVFLDYNEENFEKNLKKYFNIKNKTKITDSGRILYEFEVL